MRLPAHDVNDALPPKMSPRASQNVSQDTLKAPVYLVFRGFFVSGRLVTVLAIPRFLGVRTPLVGGISPSGYGWEHEMALTNTEVLKAKPGPSPIKMADGRGLYLLITPASSRRSPAAWPSKTPSRPWQRNGGKAGRPRAATATRSTCGAVWRRMSFRPLASALSRKSRLPSWSP